MSDDTDGEKVSGQQSDLLARVLSPRFFKLDLLARVLGRWIAQHVWWLADSARVSLSVGLLASMQNLACHRVSGRST